jgi:hypothetical protein
VNEIETNNDFAKSLQIELLEKDKEIERLNNIINTIQQEMENLNDTGIFSIKPKYVWQRIETLKGVDKE